MRIIIILIIMMVFCVASYGVSIYDIQYTTASNGNSPLMNTTVDTKGVVTAINYPGGKYIISEGAGIWKSIYVKVAEETPQVGDSVAVSGTVAEVSQQTEINTITSFHIINSGNTVPAATAVTPSNLTYNTGEPYEGVLIRLSNVHVSVAPFNGSFSVTDNTNTNCSIKDGFFPQPYAWNGIAINQAFTEILGIISFTSGSYRVNPRDLTDLTSLADIHQISLQIEEVTASKGETVSADITVSKLEADWGLNKYVLKIGYNKSIVRFIDVDNNSTLSSSAVPEVNLDANESLLTITYNGTSPLSSQINGEVLLKLVFKALTYGESILDLTSGTFNDSINAPLLSDGKIKVPIQKRIAWLNIYNDANNKKNIFNPWLNQKITIEFGSLVSVGAASSKAIIRIYDVQGRLVATPVNKNMDDANVYGLSSFIWDGRDRNRNLVPIGVYYCHLEIIDRVNGKSDTTTQPIVVAADLK